MECPIDDPATPRVRALSVRLAADHVTAHEMDREIDLEVESQEATVAVNLGAPDPHQTGVNAVFPLLTGLMDMLERRKIQVQVTLVTQAHFGRFCLKIVVGEDGGDYRLEDLDQVQETCHHQYEVLAVCVCVLMHLVVDSDLRGEVV